MFERCNTMGRQLGGHGTSVAHRAPQLWRGSKLAVSFGSDIATLLNFSDGSPITPHSLLMPCMTARAISIDASEYGAAALAPREPGTRAQWICDRTARPDRRVYGFGCCCARKYAVPRYLG